MLTSTTTGLSTSTSQGPASLHCCGDSIISSFLGFLFVLACILWLKIRTAAKPYAFWHQSNQHASDSVKTIAFSLAQAAESTN